MTEAELNASLNPDSSFIGGINIFDEVAKPVPPGTMAPPRPPGRERVPSPFPLATRPVTIFECQASQITPDTSEPHPKPSPDA